MIRTSLALLAFTITASTSPALAGSISGGGSLAPVTQPSENFYYTCKIRLAQQITSPNQGTCYAAFTAIGTTGKVTNPLGTLPELLPKNLKFQKSSADENCGTSPLAGENTFLTLSVYENKGKGVNHGQFETSLDLRVSSPENPLNFGSANTRVRYEEGFITATAQISNPTTILSFSAECVKGVK